MASRHTSPPSPSSPPSTPPSPPQPPSATAPGPCLPLPDLGPSQPARTTSPFRTSSQARLGSIAATATSSTTTVNGICGAVAGIASGIVTCPLDVIKTKLQNQRAVGRLSAGSASRYRGLVGTGRTILAEEGVRGFYRGLGPLLLGYLPTWTVYMAVYDSARDYYSARLESAWGARVAASVSAGACSTLVTNPIWVIKTRLMSQNGSAAAAQYQGVYYSSAVDAMRKIYRAEGVRAFYSGLTPALLGLSHVAIQFPLYEYFKLQLTGLPLGESRPNENNRNGYFSSVMLATFLSKICATSATYPHEVLRTRLQNQRQPIAGGVVVAGRPTTTLPAPPVFNGAFRTATTMVREEGWRVFYAGMGTNMVRAVPAAMTTMLTFEFVKTYLQKPPPSSS